MTTTPTGIEIVDDVDVETAGPSRVTTAVDNDYWHSLIPEIEAAEFLDLTPRWMQAKRQHGGGPKFVRISQRCVKYTRYWLKIYTDERLRSSTSDQGKAT